MAQVLTIDSPNRVQQQRQHTHIHIYRKKTVNCFLGLLKGLCRCECRSTLSLVKVFPPCLIHSPAVAPYIHLTFGEYFFFLCFVRCVHSAAALFRLEMAFGPDYHSYWDACVHVYTHFENAKTTANGILHFGPFRRAHCLAGETFQSI